jgi:predicted metal-dependent phosphotriesterase family hydrolase
MWNPNAYRDTDFGLPDDESFEPSGEGDTDFTPGPGDPYVQTVLGPLHPDEVGVALIHEFLQWRPRSPAPPDTLLNDPKAAMLELEAFFTASGRTVVSVTTPDDGRDAGVLRSLAQLAPVHLVATTGYSAFPSTGRELEVIRRRIQRDIEDGLDGTTTKPGMLTGTLPQEGSPRSVQAAMQMLAEIQRESGLPATIVSNADDAVSITQAAGFIPQRLIVSGSGMLNPDDAMRVAESGAFVLFSSLDGSNRAADQGTARRIASLVAEGHGDQVLVSHGFRERARLNGYGGQPGLAFIVEQFAVMLLECGLEAADVRLMLVDNTSSALSMRRATHLG